MIDPLQRGPAGGVLAPEPPLAHNGGVIPGGLQHLRQRDVLGPDRDSPLPRIQLWPVCWPSISAARDGAQTVLPAKYCVNRVPSAASRSMFGVANFV